MADLTANANLRFMDETNVEQWVLDNSAAQHPYRGSPMIIDIGTDTIYVRAFVDATTVVATDIFIGIALEETVVATTDTETDNVINMAVDGSIVGFASTVFTDADVGDPVYMSDSGTLSATIADNPCIGKLHRVLNGYAFVQIITPYICVGA